MTYLQADVIHSGTRGFRLRHDLATGQRIALTYDLYNVDGMAVIEVWLHHVKDDPTARMYLGKLAEAVAATVVKVLQCGCQVTAEVLRDTHSKEEAFPEIVLLIEV
jgi:hypothetical protein